MCEFCEERFPQLTRRNALIQAGAALAAAALPFKSALAESPIFSTQVLGVYHPPGFNFEMAPKSISQEWEDVEEFYLAYFTAMNEPAAESGYGLAIANQVLGFLRNDPAYIVRARELYTMHRETTADTKEKNLADSGKNYCNYILSGKYPSSTYIEQAVIPTVYDKEPGPKKKFQKIILGKTAIKVTKSALIKTQVDRVTRDWLLAFRPNGVPWRSESGKLFSSHEGARVTDIMTYSGATMVPVWGMQVRKIGNKWYAPDLSGVSKFEISPDKVTDYPSTIIIDDRTAIVNDTHGISAIAWDAHHATLVVGCGDHKGKMDAAYHLASLGTDVYVPTDRFLGGLIGAVTKGTIIGSAPVKQVADGAEIGNQPVEIDVDELIVVSNAVPQYPLQYYDTPFRYFNLLSDYVGRKLNIRDVNVEKYGYAVPVVEAARDMGAKVVGIRVKSRKEHDAMSAWLKESMEHRAILFHTAAYKEGYQLFSEFSEQTSFGDIHPQFK